MTRLGESTRRNFITQAAFAAATFALMGCKESAKPAKAVPNFNVPALLELDPKIAAITKQVSVPNPKQAIIVVSDVHYHREQLDLNPSKEADVLKFQRQVKAALIAMIEKLKVTDVFRDSFDATAVANSLASFRYLRAASSDLDYAASLNNKAAHPQILALKNSTDPVEREAATLFGNILGVQDLVRADAVMGLAYEGKLNLKPTEDADLAKKANEMASTDPNVLQNPVWLTLSEQREDYALKQALANSGMFKVLVFGHSHDFKENVERHNKQNPDQQVELYSVIPTGQQAFIDSFLR